MSAARGTQESAVVTAPPPDVGAATATIVIRPSHGWVVPRFREIWLFRELLFILAWRDVKVRYKQTALGFGWGIIPPFMTMVVFSVVFGGIVNVPSDGIPYPLFSYSGLVAWTFFSSGANRGALSLVGNSALISKVYFPRLIVPLAAVLTPLADLGFSLVILFGLMAWYGVVPGVAVLTLPAFVALALVTSFAFALWFSALGVKYRDVTFGITFLIQILMYVSPVIYPVSSVPERLRLLYSLNPMTGVIAGFRWALFGQATPDYGIVAVSSVVVVALVITGLVHFERVQRTFTDVL